MTPGPADTREHTNVMLSHLRDGGFRVGAAQAPEPPQFPYLVLVLLGSVRVEDCDEWMEFQVSSWGSTPEQALGLQSAARLRLEQRPPEPPGRRWMGPPLRTGGGRIQPDNSIQPPGFYIVDIVELASTPTLT